MTYVSRLGDSASAAAAAAASASACASYAADLAKWQNEQSAFISAVSARAAAMATATKAYQSAMQAYQSAVAGQQAGYAQQAAVVAARFKVTLPAGTPSCVPQATHDSAAQACYVRSSGIKGLGAFSWSSIDACVLAALPVCAKPPTAPTAPAPLPMPTLRAKPTMPAGCTTGTAAPVSAPAPTIAAPPTAPSPVPSADTPLPILAPASMLPAETKSGAGLLIVALIGAAGIGYLILRKKKPAA